MVLNALTSLHRRALGELFGADAVAAPLNGPPARPLLSVGAARAALERSADLQREMRRVT